MPLMSNLGTILCFEDFFFFFSSRRRHTRCSRDWSSDVCSSDLARPETDSNLRHDGGSPQHFSRHGSELAGLTAERIAKTATRKLSRQHRASGGLSRSEERRGGEECRSRGAPCSLKKKRQEASED